MKYLAFAMILAFLPTAGNATIAVDSSGYFQTLLQESGPLSAELKNQIGPMPVSFTVRADLEAMTEVRVSSDLTTYIFQNGTFVFGDYGTFANARVEVAFATDYVIIASYIVGANGAGYSMYFKRAYDTLEVTGNPGANALLNLHYTPDGLPRSDVLYGAPIITNAYTAPQLQRLTAVPEASTWLMMFAGFAILGSITRLGLLRSSFKQEGTNGQPAIV